MTIDLFGRSPQAHRKIAVGFLLALLAGCDDGTASPELPGPSAPPVPVAPATPPDGISSRELRERLGANDNAHFLREGSVITQADLRNSGVEDLAPLKELPLTNLFISGLPIDDLSPLADMPLTVLEAEGTSISDLNPLRSTPLRELYIRDTKVKSLESLRDLPITHLNLIGTPIDSIEPVAAMPLQTLWIASTQIQDLAPLRDKELVSLDIEGTPIGDLSMIATLKSLRRLNLAGTAVDDLTLLEGLRLERLIFTPARIHRGIEVVRGMASLQTLGTRFEDLRPASEFWNAYDSGEFADSETTSSP